MLGYPFWLPDALSGLSVTLAVCLLPVLILVVVLRGAPTLWDDSPAARGGQRKGSMRQTMSLFTRALANENLTPLERAVLKFVQSALLMAALAMLPVLATALSGGGAFDWRGTLHLLLFAGAGALLQAVVKWAKAQGDAPLAQAILGVAEVAETRLTAANGLPAPINGAE